MAESNGLVLQNLSPLPDRMIRMFNEFNHALSRLTKTIVMGIEPMSVGVPHRLYQLAQTVSNDGFNGIVRWRLRPSPFCHKAEISTN